MLYNVEEENNKTPPAPGLRVAETTNITFFLAKSCWNLVHITLEEDIPFPVALQAIRNQSHPKFFMTVAILLSWAIWKRGRRNDLIFGNIRANLHSVKETFSKEMKLLTLRAKAKHSALFDLWIQNMLQSSFVLVFSSSPFWVS
ncbi:hypothetical protein BDA96_06G208900 [Sorghum bicolor]|jgi:hypothetical protein|uniref:Uncharacterized protein n=1 Tax=Sorghum bicolor TaxID=4558 RepID=A0A921QUR9_SORBI|nr:hypothetical protein BDA96_06G208900 [Sorghum bicolor]